jgi:hypothetical protein
MGKPAVTRFAPCMLVVFACSSAPPVGAAPPDAASTPDAFEPVPPVGSIQMADLSVLLPLATSEADLAAYASASTPGAHGALLPEDLYESDGDSVQIPYDQLRVVAIRFDPCFAQVGPIADPASCDNQMRLVFQPLAFANGATTAVDAGVHVSYAITRAQLVTAVNAIAAARAQTTGDDLGPLAANPIVAAQGLTGPMAQGIAAVIASYANPARIERITSFLVPATVGIGGTPVTWQFQGLAVAGGAATPITIATLGGVTDQIFNASTMPLESLPSPATTSLDNIGVLASADEAMAATPAARQAAYDAALRIENPGASSPNTIDCASCHTAEAARRLVGEPMFGLSSAGDPNAFAAASTIPAADLVTTTALVTPSGVLDIHAFSYLGSAPMIDQRVVNETAANLAYLQSL